MVTCLYLMPTTLCNCACSYCYCTGYRTRGDPGLFIDIAGSFTDHVKSPGFQGRPQIRFTGGEPWLDGELVVRVASMFLREIPEGFVVVNTNGTMIREELLSGFRGERRMAHVVSLDGPEPIHDSRRKTSGGNGTFRNAIEGVRTLRELELPVAVNVVLDPESARGLGELMDFVAGDLGLRELSLSLRWQAEHPISADVGFELLRDAYSLATSRNILLGGHHRLLLGDRVPGLRCLAGDITVLIDPEGMLHGCQRFVGRAKPDGRWTRDFDWKGFRSCQTGCGVCGTADELLLGEALHELYTREHRSYLKRSSLDEMLFGVLG